MTTCGRRLLGRNVLLYGRNFQQQKRQTSVAPSLTKHEVLKNKQDADSAKPFEEIPGPKMYWLLGGMPHHLPTGAFYKKEHYEITEMCQKQYGNIYKDSVVPGQCMVHVFEADDIEHVFRSDNKYPIREAFFTLAHFNKKFNNNTQGLLTSQGESWHQIRKNVQQKMLRPKAVSAYMPDQLIVANDLVDHLSKVRNENGEVEDVRSDFDKFAAECVGVVCFSKRLGAFTNTSSNSDAKRFIDAVSVVMDISFHEFRKLPLHHLFDTPSFKKFVQAQQFIKEIAKKYSRQALEELERLSDKDFDGEHADLIPYLLSKTDLTEEQVLTVISEFIFAGVDTTSHHLSFLVYLLGRHQDVQEKLYSEIKTHVPDDENFGESQLAKLSYLRAVQKETHRILPVAPGNVRKITKDITLCGYNIPAGTTVALHTDFNCKQEKYFTDAKKFKPERWRRNANKLSTHPFAYSPFGFGTRSCIGRRFAEQETQLALVKLLQKFKVEYIGEDIRLKSSITYSPDNKISLRLIDR